MEESQRSTASARQTTKHRKEFESFSDPNFSVRQWLNQTLPASGAALSTPASSTTSQQQAQIAASEALASQLLSDLQVHTSDLSQQLEHGIGQALARLPRTTAEISRMASDASVISRQIKEIRTIVDPIVGPTSDSTTDTTKSQPIKQGGAGAEGASTVDAAAASKVGQTSAANLTQADIIRLQKNKEKLLWCRNVLRSAQTLSADIAAVEKGLRNLNNNTKSGGGGGGITTGSTGGIADIEHLASSIRRINVSLGTIKAVDPSFGTAHEDKIKDFERQLQLSVERECLDIVKARKSTVPIASTMTHTEARRIATALQSETSNSRILYSRRTTEEGRTGEANSTTSTTSNTASGSNRGVAPSGASPSSFVYSIKPETVATANEKAQQARANRLFAILRTIQRDGVAVESLIQTSVDDLTRFFGSVIVPAAVHAAEESKASAQSTSGKASAGIAKGYPIEALPGLLRLFFKHVGAQVAQDVAYLWALADFLPVASGGGDGTGAGDSPSKAQSVMGSSNIVKSFGSSGPTTVVVGGKVATLSDANLISAGTTNEGIDDTINDAAATIVHCTFEAIAVPLKRLITDLVAESERGGGGGGVDVGVEESINVALVLCLQSSREAEAAGKALLSELLSLSSKSTLSNATATTVEVSTPSSSYSSLLSRLSKALPKAIHSTAARQLFSPLVESFILREKRLLDRCTKKGSLPVASAPNDYPQLTFASDLLSELEPCLHRCAAFFPSETVNPCLNAWSRLAATVLNELCEAVGKDVATRCAPSSTLTNDTLLVQKLVSAAASVGALQTKIVTVQSDCFASFVTPSTSTTTVTMAASSSSLSSGAASSIDIDILQSCLRVVEKETTKSVSVCKAALLRVLAFPMERLLVGKYSTLPCWRAGDSNLPSAGGVSSSAAKSAQSRDFSTGSASPSEAVRECCDLLMDVPVSLEANGIPDDERATLFKAVVVEVIAMMLGEVSAALGAAPEAAVATKLNSSANASSKQTQHLAALLAPNGKHSIISGVPTLRRYPSRLLCLTEVAAINQLSVDLDYLSSIVSYCGIEEGGGGSSTTATNDGVGTTAASYVVDEAERAYEQPADYWASSDGTRCVSEYSKRLSFALPSISVSNQGGEGGFVGTMPSDLAEVIESASGDASASGSAYSVFMRLQRHLASLSQRAADVTSITTQVPFSIIL